MTVFDTPEPIFVTIELGTGDIRLQAAQRADTIVEVRPSDPANDADVKVAEHVVIYYADGTLVVKAPRYRGLLARSGSIDVTIQLPAGSDISGVARDAAFRATGRLGDCRYKTSTGDIQLAESGTFNLVTSVGDITVDLAEGPVEATTSSGAIRIRELLGPAVLKNSNGSISVDKAHAAIEAKTASGDIRIAEAGRDSIILGTSVGQLEVGVRTGTAALLDVRSMAGNVHNFLTPADGPGSSDRTVEIRAITTVGDVAIRRA
ncbi:DUF4097 domain-containing protein [Nocardia sp. NPDC060256]|uniref:DUF4097 family beta strand repeat-containing protein n=1 Tax=unclassified Nocardia TaxID=2637762 RepID=UPI0036628B08